MRQSRNFLLSVLSLLLGTLIWVSCATTPSEPGTNNTSSVAGVLQTKQGYTIPEAVVEAYNSKNERIATDTTDNSGGFSFTGLPEDLAKINLRIEHPDYKTATVDLKTLIANSGGGNTGVAYTMETDDSCCGTVIVNVYGSNGAINEADVRLRRGGHQVAATYSNDHGQVIFTGVCAGTLNIRIAKTGYHVAEPNITLHDCDTVVLNDTLTANGMSHEDSCCNGVLTVNVADSANNESISGATVTISRSGVTHTATTENGHARFTGLCEGQYVVHVGKEHSYRTIEFSQSMGCSDTQTVNKVIAAIQSNGADSCCAGYITFTGRDSASNAVLTGGSVRLWHGSTLLQTKEMNANGVTFEHLCEGTYQLSVSKDGYHGIEFNVSIGCNGHESPSRLLAHEASADTCCGGVVEISIKDSTHQTALNGATAQISRNGTVLRSTNANDLGNVRFGDLCSGNYRIVLTKDGYAQRVIEFELGCNQTKSFARALLANTSSTDSCCTARMQITLRDSLHHDTKLTGATVTIRLNDHTIATGTTNGDGVYVREDLCGYHTYVVKIELDGYNTKTFSWAFTDCHNYTETIYLGAH